MTYQRVIGVGKRKSFKVVRHKYLVLRNAHKSLKIDVILRGSFLEITAVSNVAYLGSFSKGVALTPFIEKKEQKDFQGA